jgi:hypothetical protein
VNSRCSSPTEIKYSKLLFTSTSIGMSARYKCNAGYLGTGNPQIVCQPNVKWSFTSFNCTSNTCPTPKPVENADLVSVDYSGEGSLYRKGTQLNYSCKIDYQGENQTTTNICDSNGICDPERVFCCKNGTVSSGKRCLRAFPVQLEMSLDGSLTIISPYCIS